MFLNNTRLGLAQKPLWEEGGQRVFLRRCAGRGSKVVVSRTDGRTSVLGDHLHPRGRVDLHQGVRYVDHVHAVQDGREHRVPEPGLALEIEHAHHGVAFGVVARLRQRPALVQHGRAAGRHAHHGPVAVSGVLDVRRGVVAGVRRRAPVLGRLGQVLGDEPMELGPALERRHVAGRGLGQALEARVRRERHLDAAAAQQEADLLRTGVPAGQRHLDGHGHDAGERAAVERAQEVQRVAVRVDQSHTVAVFQTFAAAAAGAFDQRPVEQRVGYFVRSAEEFACRGKWLVTTCYPQKRATVQDGAQKRPI